MVDAGICRKDLYEEWEYNGYFLPPAFIRLGVGDFGHITHQIIIVSFRGTNLVRCASIEQLRVWLENGSYIPNEILELFFYDHYNPTIYVGGPKDHPLDLLKAQLLYGFVKQEPQSFLPISAISPGAVVFKVVEVFGLDHKDINASSKWSRRAIDAYTKHLDLYLASRNNNDANFLATFYNEKKGEVEIEDDIITPPPTPLSPPPLSPICPIPPSPPTIAEILKKEKEEEKEKVNKPKSQSDKKRESGPPKKRKATEYGENGPIREYKKKKESLGEQARREMAEIIDETFGETGNVYCAGCDMVYNENYEKCLCADLE